MLVSRRDAGMVAGGIPIRAVHPGIFAASIRDGGADRMILALGFLCALAYWLTLGKRVTLNRATAAAIFLYLSIRLIEWGTR